MIPFSLARAVRAVIVYRSCPHGDLSWANDPEFVRKSTSASGKPGVSASWST